ncbi:MAG: FAD-dependent oxidoreductase [Bacteroidetes bacterium]|nr:FAD-dependent oxidoreductase [Bacteroidota bacterium]HET6243544.1 NAD(P)-binding protein [Bacteroidia bacterium]
MNIAIIGAGVSGLTTAYYLRQNPLLKDATITIYEKAGQVGGNADTFQVELPDGSGGSIQRWVDMGVNDFNLGTYKVLTQLWQEFGIMNNNIPCPGSPYCSPLIDTESFSLPDNNYTYRYSVGADGCVTVPYGSSANQSILQQDIDNFKQALADWYNNNSQEGVNPITVGDWLLTQKFSEEFIFCNLYPRINGMYFTLESNLSQSSTPPPSTMPLWMVAHYYILQEAYGQVIQPSLACSRQYFVDGSSQWLKFLANKLTTELNVTINFNCPELTVSRVEYSEKITKMVLSNNGTGLGIYDKVIFATHADDTFNMIDNSFKSDEMVEALQSFEFSSSNIIVHQDHSFLAPQADCNNTYNIHIYDYQPTTAEYPYTISYIANYHQNDVAKGINDPLFFITLNPYWELDASKILKQPDGSLAQTTLRHCKLNTAAMNAQVLIDEIQLEAQTERSYYFAGSFARGAGLHMECIIHAQELAKKIANPSYISNQTYKFKGGQRHFAPKYVLDALTRIKKEEMI